MTEAKLRSLLHTIDAVRLTEPHALITASHGFALHLSKMPDPLLCPLPEGSGVLLEDWTDSLTQCFYVPSAQMDDVRLALGLSQVEQDG